MQESLSDRFRTTRTPVEFREPKVGVSLIGGCHSGQDRGTNDLKNLHAPLKRAVQNPHADEL